MQQSCRTADVNPARCFSQAQSSVNPSPTHHCPPSTPHFSAEWPLLSCLSALPILPVELQGQEGHNSPRSKGDMTQNAAQHYLRCALCHSCTKKPLIVLLVQFLQLQIFRFDTGSCNEGARQGGRMSAFGSLSAGESGLMWLACVVGAADSGWMALQIWRHLAPQQLTADETHIPLPYGQAAHTE